MVEDWHCNRVLYNERDAPRIDVFNVGVFSVEMWVRFAHSCLSGPYERELTPDDSDPNVTADDIGEIIGAKCFFVDKLVYFWISGHM